MPRLTGLPGWEGETWPAFTCNSPKRDSQWAIFGAAVRTANNMADKRMFWRQV